MDEPRDEEGTPESEWLPWLAEHDLPVIVWPATGTLTVVAPHPDDEVLGVGGIMHDLSAWGWRVEVVAVTDGEASHPRSSVHAPEALAALRREETRRALRALGLSGRDIHHLELPDGEIAAHEETLAERIGDVLDATTVLLHPHPDDGHPDHDATARAATAAARTAGIPSIGYPVWLWHHRTPADVDWSGARVHPLGGATRARKSIAIDCFGSQIRPLGDQPGDAPILPPPVLRRFRRPFEVIFT